MMSGELEWRAAALESARLALGRAGSVSPRGDLWHPAAWASITGIGPHVAHYLERVAAAQAQMEPAAAVLNSALASLGAAADDLDEALARSLTSGASQAPGTIGAAPAPGERPSQMTGALR